MTQQIMPAVSVIMPSFNHASYVQAAVESVLDSSFPDLELVVVDDGSTDLSVEIIRTIKDPRLRVVVQSNQGAHAAMNRGAAMARANWLAFVNSDDLFAPQKIERHLQFHEENPTLEATASRMDLINDAGMPLPTSDPIAAWYYNHSNQMVTQYGSLYKSLLAANHLLTTSALFVSKGAYQQLGGFLPLRYTHDWFMFLSLASRAKFAIIEQPLACYRLHATNTIRENPGRLIAETTFVIEWHISQAFSKGNPKLDPCEVVRIVDENSLTCNEIVLLCELSRLANGNNPQETARIFSQPGHPVTDLALRLIERYQERQRSVQELAHRDQLLSEILNSRSWKLTMPMRRFYDYRTRKGN